MFKNLFMFAPDDGAGDGGAPAGGNPAEGAPAGGNEGNDDGHVANGAAPTAEEIQASLLSDLGVDNFEDLKGIIKANNDAKAASQTELENAQSNLEKTNKTLSKETARANAAEESLAAYKLGVDEGHIADALALARADMADKSKGLKNITDALSGVLNRNPAFKGQANQVNPDGTNAIVGGNASGNGSNQKNDIAAQVAKLNEFRITN